MAYQHLLRKDCILAPIPAADYAQNSDELVLLPDIGTVAAEKLEAFLPRSAASRNEFNCSNSQILQHPLKLLKFLLKMKFDAIFCFDGS